jgi:hypothetical protein
MGKFKDEQTTNKRDGEGEEGTKQPSGERNHHIDRTEDHPPCLSVCLSAYLTIGIVSFEDILLFFELFFV